MKRSGFSKKERLLRSFQFKSVYQQRRVSKSALLWIYHSSNGLSHNRIGISVSNKICCNLVVRNRVKRLIRQIYRENKDVFGCGQDFVFVVKTTTKNPDYADFRKTILKLLEIK